MEDKAVNDRLASEIADIEDQAQRKALYSSVFATDEGKKVLQDICEVAGMHTSHTGNLDRSEGRRELALEILHLAKADPQRIIEDSINRINRLKGQINGTGRSYTTTTY